MFVRTIAQIEEIDPAEVRRELHDMRVKGWAVTGDNDGMHRTHTIKLIENQAEKLLAQADKLREAAQGMIRKAHEPLTERQERIWEYLDWKDLPEADPFSHFNFINEKGEEINDEDR